MGLFSFLLGGIGFVSIGACESFFSISGYHRPAYSLEKSEKTTSSLTLFASTILSLLFVLHSLISILKSSQIKDQIVVAFQLQGIPIAFSFLLYSIAGILTTFTGFLHLPSSILDLIVLFAFGEEFLLFYFQRKDPTGLENRYYDLVLFPVSVCALSTILSIVWPRSHFPKLGRGMGLILHGTWFIQMGFSFYTSLMAHGCFLHETSTANYTVRCKGHPEYHRSRGIATLQFNFHLAFAVICFISMYSMLAKKLGSGNDNRKYKPISEELTYLDNPSNFTLDSDEEEIRSENNLVENNGALHKPERNRITDH